MKWACAFGTAVVVGGLVTSTERLSCAEVTFSVGTMVDCESISIFQPRVGGGDADSAPGVLASIPIRPWLTAVLGAMYRGSCETTEVPEGQWTVCDDGFSMLEREEPTAAWALGLRPGEHRPVFGVRPATK